MAVAEGSAAVMAVDAAQFTRVRKCSGFMSPAEVQRVLRTVRLLGLQPYTSDPAGDVTHDGEPIHCTTYLNTDGIFARRFPRLRRRILALAAKACAAEGWGWDLSTCGTVRCAEYHEMLSGAALADMDHYDEGSLVTIDILLEAAGSGGIFQTVEPGGALCTHDFCQGDALVFCAHKYHRVSPVTSGRRQVLVVELWDGDERQCGHRCPHHRGDCHFRDDAS